MISSLVRHPMVLSVLPVSFVFLGCVGAGGGPRAATVAKPAVDRSASVALEAPERTPVETTGIRQASNEEPVEAEKPDPADALPELRPVFHEDLRGLVLTGLSANPRLARLQAEAAAAWARVPQIDALPDPMVGANVFAAPIETAAGSQRANLTLSQKLPYLKRLRAAGQQAAFEAMSLDHSWQAESLIVVGDVRATYYALYLVDRRLEINEGNEKILRSLVEIATQRVGQGQASQGDVLLGTVELSKLAEERIALRRRRVQLVARMNELLNRPAASPVVVAEKLAPDAPMLDGDVLVQLANERQPAIAAAALRVNAAAWGVKVARLADVPDVTLGVTWYAIEDNRPPSSVVDVGEDAWSVGAAINVPLYRRKYRAMECEAVRRQRAARLGVDEVRRKYESLIADLVERARAADETARLYDETIVPQARQTLESDQGSYAQGRVEFDRVIRDFRNLLLLEVGYHRAVSDLATAVARIEQAVGVELAPLARAARAGREASHEHRAEEPTEPLPLPEPDDGGEAEDSD